MSTGVEEILRVEGGQVLATLIRMTRDFELAEDAVQDAAIEALDRWADDLPANPGAWLTTVAKRKALDRIRKESRRVDKETEAVRLLDQGAATDDGGDDRLRLLFTCCHPALAPDAQVALTLRTIGGLTTPEIARAFLVSEPTMGQRISRAKKKIKVAAIPYRVPADQELPERLDAVLAVLYVIYTTGHHAPIGSARGRVDLEDEAIRLGRLLALLMPDEPEAHGLLGLMLATSARRPGRMAPDGSLVLLEDQDRTTWDADLVAEATAEVDSAMQARRVGSYSLQAAVALEHSSAPRYGATDWTRIADLYGLLATVDDSPIVAVNRSVALAKADGPAAGLAVLEGVNGVDGWHLYWAAKASFLEELGHGQDAIEALDLALDCPMNDDDRALLEDRRSRLAEPERR